MSGSKRLEVKRALARKRLRRDIEKARERTEDFIEFALVNEKTGRRIKNAPFHVEWQKFLRANNWVVLIAPVEHAKTQQVSVGKVLHMLGKNPNLRIALISDTKAQAQKVLRSIRAHIERNERVRQVFPDLVPSDNPEDPWSNDAITVKRTIVGAKDASIEVCGAFGAINGSRKDVIILDDVLDFENTRTDTQREKMIDWVDTTVITRLTDNGNFYAIGTPWHRQDLLHKLSEREMFEARKYSSVENPDDPPHKWLPVWPESWSIKRLLQRKGSMLVHAFTRKYLCRVRLDSTARFRELWLERAKTLGKGLMMSAELPRGPTGHYMPCFTGVDLGIGQGERDADTVIFTIALMPNGRRRVLEVEAGKWQGPEIIDRLVSTYKRFESVVMVESNGGQKFITQFAQQYGGIPVTPFHTGSNKWNPEFGVESLAVEMRNTEWVIPSGMNGDRVHPEVEAWIEEMLNFDPEEHTGDRLMASWLAREALRKYAGGISRRTNVTSR